jgi:ribosomal protein S18 acetylase RimI-like enzyme
MLRARLQTFDSGKVAARVGYVIAGRDDAIGDADILELIEAAEADSFELIWIQTCSRLETTLLDYRGTLVEVEGDRENVLSRARLASPRYEVRALESDWDWGKVERLMRFAAATRFSADPHISEAAVRHHKLSLLKSHVENKHGAVALAYSIEEPARFVGYQCTSLEEHSVQLYEIAVDTRFRRGFAAANLVRYNLDRFASAYPDAKRVVARIYDDNVASLRFFERLGLSPTGRLLHYYHCWPARLGTRAKGSL